MAHIGRFGPVAFRRDLNLNITNNDYGWQRRYIWQANNIPTGIAKAIDHKIFDCGPETYPDKNSISWFSQFTKYGVARYAVQLVATINPDGSTYYEEGALIVLNQGIIWHWQFSALSGNRPGFDTTAFAATDFYDPAWFDVEPQGRSIYTVPKRWTDGPPH